MSENQKDNNGNLGGMSKEKTNEDFNKKNETRSNPSDIQKTPGEKSPNIGDVNKNDHKGNADRTKQNDDAQTEKPYQPNKELPKIGDQGQKNSIENAIDQNKDQKHDATKVEGNDQHKNTNPSHKGNL